MITRWLSHFSFLAACVTAMSMVFPAGARGEPPPPVPDWGTTSTTILRIGSSSFTGANSGYAWDQSEHWRYPQSGGLYTQWEADLNLPSGSLITHISAEVYDNSDGDISLSLGTCANLSPTCTFTPLILTSGKPGYSWNGATLVSPITVDNSANSYHVRIGFTEVGGLQQFRSVLIRYNLQVSPAPATATFSDVPTSYWAFQYIEALAASGITVGCTPSTYCPEDPVTRAQMAVFLAKALGLHWPG